jgi:peptidoglycan-associated lipoprotein
MNRKWMATVWVSALALGVLLAGCPKKKPVTVADDMSDTTPAPAPAPQEVEAPAAPAPVDQTPSPWDQDLQTAQEEAERLGLIGDVYFDFDKYELKQEARDRLEKNAAFMRDKPQFVFTIEGHCDERGTNEYNLALGDRRANAARDYLVSLGVPAARVRTISYGEERGFCGEHNESCWWRNRRGHFVISGKTSG